MKNKIVGLLLFFTFLVGGVANSQTQQEIHDVPFGSGLQDMWGPGGGFSINQVITLFDESWNVPFNTGNGGIVTILGQQFGAGVQGGFSGRIGSTFSLLGFTLGQVEVDYPIKVTNTLTNDLTYDQGDDVLIETNYTVESGWALDTHYPSAGEMKMDLFFELGASLSATVCAFGCINFPIIPSFNTGLQNVNIFTVNSGGAEFFSLNGGTPLYSIPGFPIDLSTIPGNPMPDYGLNAILNLPYVVTSDNLDPTTKYLRACGESTYVEMSLDIFALLGNLPAPVGPVLGNLSGSEDLGPFATINWNFFSTSFNADIINKQCFDFKPKVYGKYVFPVAVDYTILNSIGSTVASGTSSIITVEIGNDIRYKFPCYYEDLHITPTYSIDGRFTNHTYDSIAFYVLMSAFEFSLVINPIEITPAINVPEICINIPYPCPTWSKPWRWCSSRVCTPAFTIPAIGYAGTTIGFGPLWSTTIPLGAIKYDWFKKTWSLGGFDEYTFAAFTMKAGRLIPSTTHTNVLCYGGNNGAIDLSISAISPALPYTYIWTNGATTQDLTGLAAGPYEVQIMDAHQCQLFTGATILEPEQPLSITYTKTDKLCNGGVNNGSIDVLIQGGTLPYTKNWSNGATTEDINGLAAGTYTLTVTDGQGCTKALSVTIDEPSTLGQNAAITHVNCKGNADGAIAIDIFGGVLPYGYSWSSGQTIEDITDLTAGNYLLTVTDGNGCTNLAPYSVTEPLLDLALSSIPTHVLCKDDLTGGIDVTTTGGTAGYSFVWVNSQGVVLPYQTEDISNIGASTYTLVVSDSKGCTAQISEVVNEPLENLKSSPILQNINCFGEATGQIDPVISGGTLGYSYAWSNGATSSTLSNAVAGNYTLTVTDGNGCSDVYSYELTQPLAALSISLDGTDVLCFGENTGAVISNVDGGSGGYSYAWNNSANTPNIQNIIAGPYSVQVTDAKGCQINDNIVINQPLAPLNLTSAIVHVDCYGNNSGSIDVTTTGGTTPFYFSWANSGTIVMVDTTEDISNQVADDYEITVTDDHGCTESLVSTIDQPTAPIAITGIVDDVNCFGMNDGGIDISVSGGTIGGGYTYSWSSGASSQDNLGITSGNYTVTVTDQNLCTQSANFNVNQPLEPLAASVEATDAKCTNGTDGMLISSVTGGTSPYTYAWSSGETSPNLYNLSAGVYNLTVTDAQGCTSFSGSVINQPAQLLDVTYTSTDVLCFGGSDGTIGISITGGVQPYYYNWGNQGEILINNFTENLTGLNEGEYFVRVTDRNGCVNEQYITINEPTLLVTSFTTTDVLCFGESTGEVDVTNSGGTPPYTTTWSDGQTTEDAVGLAAGTYFYTVLDDHLCEVSDTAYIYEPTKVEITWETSDVTCIDESNGAIFVTADGGVRPYDFVWNNGAVVPNIGDLAVGNYSLTVTDANSCASNYVFEIFGNEDDCLFIPNTITPNGDDYNDTWIIENIDMYPGTSVKIFNKWGNKVFDSGAKYEPWNGEFKGAPLPSEVYFYIITLGSGSGKEYTGTITIIR